MFSDIYPCPESVRTLPWLGIRVRLTNETMTHDELAAFWKIAESNYIWIKILEILKDSYSIQIKIDYTILLRQERMKSLLSNRGVHIGVQVWKQKKHFFFHENKTFFFLFRQCLMKDHYQRYVHRIVQILIHV